MKPDAQGSYESLYLAVKWISTFHGIEFQRLCDRFFAYTDGDYVSTRAGGPMGDLSADGYVYWNQTYFACHAPERTEVIRKVKTKIREDFEGCTSKHIVRTWVFCTNQPEIPEVSKYIHELVVNYNMKQDASNHIKLEYYTNVRLAKDILGLGPVIAAGILALPSRYLTDDISTLPFSSLFSGIKATYRFTESIDESLLKVLRIADRSEQSAKTMVYRNYYEAEFSRLRMSLQRFFQELQDEEILETSHWVTSPDMKIHVDDHFRRVVFEHNDTSISVDGPQLLWDCHCARPRGSFATGDRPSDASTYTCPIHSHILGDSVSAIFGSGLISIEYMGLRFLWHNSREFWPPSIDTFHMLDKLEAEGIFHEHIDSILDLGCGTGAIGIHAAKKNPNVKHLYLADWLITPLLFAKINWELNKGYDTHITCHPLLGFNTNWINSSGASVNADLCICNPPYLPDLGRFPQIKTYSTVGGTELLESVIEHGRSIAKRVYVNFSNLATVEAFAARDRAKAKLTEIGEPHKVPFRIREAFKHPEYINALSDRGLIEERSGRYKYWHLINTYRVEY